MQLKKTFWGVFLANSVELFSLLLRYTGAVHRGVAAIWQLEQTHDSRLSPEPVSRGRNSLSVLIMPCRSGIHGSGHAGLRKSLRMKNSAVSPWRLMSGAFRRRTRG